MMKLLEPERTGLLLIDFQVDVCAEGGKMVSQEEEVLARFMRARKDAARLLDHIRAHEDGFVVHVQHLFDPGYPELEGSRASNMSRYVQEQGAFIAGTPGAQIVPELQQSRGELVLRKHTISAFESTDLDVRLRRRRIDTLIIGGVVAHYAVLSAALSASDRGYHVIVPRSTTTSATQDRYDFALSVLGPLVTVAELDDVLSGFNTTTALP